MAYYFLKKIIRENLGQSEDRLTMTDYHTSFNFLDRIHADKQNKVKEMLQSIPERTLIADIGAATLARLVRAGTQGRDSYMKLSLIQEALQCCRAIISKQNYDPIPLSHLHDSIPNTDNNVMLIAGAQESRVRDSRVIAAFECTKRLHNINFTIALAGLRPPPPKQVRSKDEAKEMKILLENLIEKDGLSSGQLMPRIVDITSESESQTTKENIQKFFETNVLDTRKKNNIFITSSTFHLIRLSNELEKQVLMNYDKYPVSNIILVGSEDQSDTSLMVAQLHNYVKAMFFEVFDYLLEQSKESSVPFEKIPK